MTTQWRIICLVSVCLVGMVTLAEGSIGVIENIDVLKITSVEIKPVEESESHYLDISMVIDNRNEHAVKLTDCNFDFFIGEVHQQNDRTYIGSDITHRTQDILLEPNTPTDVVFSIKMDTEDQTNLETSILILNFIGNLTNEQYVFVQGKFDLGIQTDQGWSYAETVRIEWMFCSRDRAQLSLHECFFEIPTPKPTLTPTRTPTPMPPPTPTLPPSPTPTPMLTPTPTLPPSPTPTPDPTATPTCTPMPTSTPTPVFEIEEQFGLHYECIQERCRAGDLPTNVCTVLQHIVNTLYTTKEGVIKGIEQAAGSPLSVCIQAIIEECIVEKTVIYFKSNSSEIEQLVEYPDRFKQLEEWTKKYHSAQKGVILHIEGHADGHGENADHLKLSRDRARSVYEYITERFKFDWEEQDNLIIEGFGKERLISKETDEASRQKNRRVELFITEKPSIFRKPKPLSSNVQQGLIAYYPFDGDTADASGNERHAHPYGAVLVGDRFGNPKRAYCFDGIDDHVERPYDPAFTPGHRSWTVSAWVKPWNGGKAVSWYGCGATRQCGPLQISAIYTLSAGANGASFMMRDDSGRTGDCKDCQNLSSPEIPLKGSWHLVTGVLDRTQRVWKLYVDGKEVARNSFSSRAPLTDKGISIPLEIGGHFTVWDPNQYYEGMIDEVRIYDRALSEAEIQELYHE